MCRGKLSHQQADASCCSHRNEEGASRRNCGDLVSLASLLCCPVLVNANVLRRDDADAQLNVCGSVGGGRLALNTRRRESRARRCRAPPQHLPYAACCSRHPRRRSGLFHRLCMRPVGGPRHTHTDRGSSPPCAACSSGSERRAAETRRILRPRPCCLVPAARRAINARVIAGTRHAVFETFNALPRPVPPWPARQKHTSPIKAGS